MEVFPPDDPQSNEVGGNRPTVSHLEQIKAWDDSFADLEKALQAACETNEAYKDIDNCIREPAVSSAAGSLHETAATKTEAKRKWEDEIVDSVDSSQQKLKRMNSMILSSGEVTIQLVNSPCESCDNIPISNLLSSIKTDAKSKFEEFSFDLPEGKTSSETKSAIELIKLENKTEIKVEASDVKIEKKPDIFSDLDKPASVKEESCLSSDMKMTVSREIKSDSGFTDDLSTESKNEFYSQSDDALSYNIKDETDIKSEEELKCPLLTEMSDAVSTMSTVSSPPSLKENEELSSGNNENSEQITEDKKDDKDKEEPVDKNMKKEDKLSKKKKFERCNIRDIKLEEELDAVTLSAQKEEQERIQRLQEAQMRALQERLQQIEVEKEALSQLFGQSAGEEGGLFETNSLTDTEVPADEDKVSIKTEADDVMVESSDDDKKAKLKNVISSAIATPIEENIIDISSSSSGNESDSEDSEKKDDDVMVLSDEGEPETAEDPNNSGAHTNDCFNLPDEEGRVLVNVGHPPEDPDIFLAPQIAKVIKPHQIGGIRFLYDNVVENLERYKTSSGFGCILAHSMGLGKTVQVVSFIDVFLRHTPANLVLCIVPINTIQNWKAEFDMWVPPSNLVDDSLILTGEVRPRDYNIYTLNENFKTMAARASLIAEWRKSGGVLLMGYEMYRMLALRKMPKITAKKSKRKKQEINLEPETNEQIKKYMDEMYEHIVIPGPDLVICDEGHRIKNSLASTSMALKSIKTRRRVVLTGYPLQNNLLEYWCMVDFVRPNYLGSRAEFCNMFERPISNGQCIDSTPRDRQLMRFRSHVLHSLLVGFVQRRGHSVLRAVLPKKEEHVLLIRMTPIQRQLYKCFVKDLLYVQQATNPLKLFAVCCKIWNHPDILYKLLQEKKAQEDIDLDIDMTLAASSGVSVSNCGARKRGYQAKSKLAQKSLKAPPRSFKSEPSLNVIESIKSEPVGCDPGNAQKVTDLKLDAHDIKKEDYCVSNQAKTSSQKDYSPQMSQSLQNTYNIKSSSSTPFGQSNYDLQPTLQYSASNQNNQYGSKNNLTSPQQHFSPQPLSATQHMYSQSSVADNQYGQPLQNQFSVGSSQNFNQVDSQIQPPYGMHSNINPDVSTNQSQSPTQTSYQTKHAQTNPSRYSQQTDILKQLQNSSHEHFGNQSNSNQDSSFSQSLSSSLKFVQSSQPFSQNSQQPFDNNQTSQQFPQQQAFSQGSKPPFSDQQPLQFTHQVSGNQPQTSFSQKSNSDQPSVQNFSSQSSFHSSSQGQFPPNHSQQSSPLSQQPFSHQTSFSQLELTQQYPQSAHSLTNPQPSQTQPHYPQVSTGQAFSQQCPQQSPEYSQSSQQFQQQNMQAFPQQQTGQSQFNSTHQSYSETSQTYSTQESSNLQQFSQQYIQSGQQYPQQTSQENVTSTFGASQQFPGQPLQGSKFSNKQEQQNKFSKSQGSVENIQYSPSVVQKQPSQSPEQGNKQSKFNQQNYSDQHSPESQFSQIGQPSGFSQQLSQSNAHSFTEQITNMTSQYTMQQATSLQFSSQISNSSQFNSQSNKPEDTYVQQTSQFSQQQNQPTDPFVQQSSQYNQTHTSQYTAQPLQNSQHFSQQSTNNQQFDSDTQTQLFSQQAQHTQFSQQITQSQTAFSQEVSQTSQTCSQQPGQNIPQYNEQVSASFSQQQSQLSQQFPSQVPQAQQYSQLSQSGQQFLHQGQTSQHYNQTSGQPSQLYTQQPAGSSQLYSQTKSSQDFNLQPSTQYNQTIESSSQYPQQSMSSQIFGESVGQPSQMYNQTSQPTQQYNSSTIQSPQQYNSASQPNQFSQTSMQASQQFASPEAQNSPQVNPTAIQSSQQYNQTVTPAIQSFEKSSNQTPQAYNQQSNQSSEQFNQASEMFGQPSQTYKQGLQSSQYNQNNVNSQPFNQTNQSPFSQKNSQTPQQQSHQPYSQTSQSPQQYTQQSSQSSQQFNQPVQSPQQFSQPVQSPQQFSQQAAPSPQQYNQSPQQFNQPPAPSPQQYQHTTPSPQQFIQQPTPPQQFSQPSQSPQQFSQPAASPQQFSQPSPSPQQQFSQPIPSPQQFSQPAPSSQHFTQPNPSPQQYSQPVPSPQQFTQPVPSPQQFSQPAPSPQPFSQPAPSPQQYSQPGPSPQQFTQAVPSPQQFPQTAPSSQQFNQQASQHSSQVQYSQQTPTQHFSQQSTQSAIPTSQQYSNMTSTQYKQQTGQSSQYSIPQSGAPGSQSQQYSNTFSSNQSPIKSSFQTDYQSQPSVSAPSQGLSPQSASQQTGKQCPRNKTKSSRVKSLGQASLPHASVQSSLKQPPSFSVQAFQNGNPSSMLQRPMGQQSVKSLQDSSNSLFQPLAIANQENFTLQHINQDSQGSYSAKCSKAILQPVKSQSQDLTPSSQVNSDTLPGEIDSKNITNPSDAAVVPFRDRIDSSINYEWAVPIMKDYVLGVLENSHKMMVLFVIIAETLQMGDKLLVFSQSLSTLDLLEQFLSKLQVPRKPDQPQEIVMESWSRNKNYFRLDGSTSAQEREKLINEFNRNDNVSLFLLSTRAGCLGINLVGANRIVVMDASWNPCHDAQAVCRIYRYGQKKQCYIYRLVTDNSLEKRIYDRQVNKQGMSDRVVDELNPESNFTWKDVTTLIQDDEDDGPVQELTKFASAYTDKVLQYLVSEMSPSLSKEPFEHESLLLDRKDLKLTKQEKRLAKQSYEMAKRANMINIRTTYTYLPAGAAGGGQFILNNKQCQWVGGTTIRVLPNQANSGNTRSGTTATPITASPSLMSSLFKQGVMVQKLTMPSNVSIPVLTPGAPPVVIPAGQDVLVLRTPKGVYLRLPDGRIIAVQLPPSLLAKTQFRPNVVTHFRPAGPKGNSQSPVINTPRGQSIGIIKQTLQCGGTVRYLGPRSAAGNSGHNSHRSSAPEVIDLSDDDEPSLRKQGIGSNTSANSSESESGSGDQDKSEKTPIFPGKHITIRKITSNSPTSREKCEIPQVLSKNKQITILPINPSPQQNRQKLAPQLAQPVRVQQMLLQPQQGKRKPIQKNTAKLQMSPLLSGKSVRPQITITQPSNLQSQKMQQSLFQNSKNLEISEKSSELNTSIKQNLDSVAIKGIERNPKSSPSLHQQSMQTKSQSNSESGKMHGSLLPPSLAALAVNPSLQITPASRPESSVSDMLSQKSSFQAKFIAQSISTTSCLQNENSQNVHTLKSGLLITPATRSDTVTSDSVMCKISQHHASPTNLLQNENSQNVFSSKSSLQITPTTRSEATSESTMLKTSHLQTSATSFLENENSTNVFSLKSSLQITPTALPETTTSEPTMLKTSKHYASTSSNNLQHSSDSPQNVYSLKSSLQITPSLHPEISASECGILKTLPHYTCTTNSLNENSQNAFTLKSGLQITPSTTASESSALKTAQHYTSTINDLLNENSQNSHSLKSSIHITPASCSESSESETNMLRTSQHSKSPVKNVCASSTISPEQANTFVLSSKPTFQISQTTEPTSVSELPHRTLFHSKSPVQNTSNIQVAQTQNIVQSLNPNLQITPIPRSEQSSISELYPQQKPSVQNISVSSGNQIEHNIHAANPTSKTAHLQNKPENMLTHVSTPQNASSKSSVSHQLPNFPDVQCASSPQIPVQQQNSMQPSSFQLFSQQPSTEIKSKQQSQQQSIPFSSQSQTLTNTQISYPSSVSNLSLTQNQHTAARKRKSSCKQSKKSQQQQAQHLLMPQNHVLHSQTMESSQPFLHPQLSDHLLPENHFPTFTHHISGSDFTAFSNFSSHKSATHIQHPQPLHPLQHSQEHSLLPHLQHMSHLYPMSPHLAGASSLPDVQPPAPRAWPVPQPPVSSFLPFSQSSPFFSSGPDGQFSFPSSFPLAPSNLTSSLSQSDSNANVASGSEKSPRIGTLEM